MFMFKKLFAAAVLGLALAGGAGAATTSLKVHVQDNYGAAIGSVTVAAIQFGMNGPSTYTLSGLTDANGNVFFNVERQMSYNILCSSQGYSPTISDQFNNPQYDPNRYVWAMDATPVYSTFTLTKNLTDVGRLVQEFANATPNRVLFGGVYNMLSQMQEGSGIVFTGSGNGILVVDNIPYADANTYSIGLYDPEKNTGIGRNVMGALEAASAKYEGVPAVAYVGAAALDFSKSIPPARVDNTSAGSVSGASVEGVLVSTNGVPVPHMGIGIKGCAGYQWNTWANSDDNGHFQLYGLTPGVTYYLNVMGGCTWGTNGPGACYAPYSSTQYNAEDICLADNSSVGPNEIVYVSSDVLYHKVELEEMPKSNGQIKVCVKTASGMVLPNANVAVNPDGTPWPKNPDSCLNSQNYTMFFSTNFAFNPGFSNANANTGLDGCATLDGLPSGNYMVNVWTPFSNNSGNSPFNGGPDGQFAAWGNNPNTTFPWGQAHCSDYGSDDFRVAVDTTVAQTMRVYNSTGNVVTDGVVDISSITYIVATGGNTSGEVKGTVRFPGVVDLRNSPILITLYGQCQNGMPCPAGNFAAVDGYGSDNYTYSIKVSSGFAYYMNVNSVGWGRVRSGGGDNSVHLESTTVVTVDMDFARSGMVSGTVYKPDGTIFTPADNQYVWIDADTNNGWAGAQLQKDGTFAIQAALPGMNRINMNFSSSDGSSSFNYALPSPAPTLNVVAGATATLNINLVNANYVGLKLDESKTPDQRVVMDGYEAVLGYKAVPLPAGTIFNSATIIKMLTGGDSDLERVFRYSGVLASGDGPCGTPWTPSGFCAGALPSPAVYDVYLMRAGNFGKTGGLIIPDMPYPHFTMINSVKNVVVDTAHATSTVRMSAYSPPSTGVEVNLTPPVDMSSRGNATLFGNVTAANFFRQADYDATGGDFNKFVQYLPVVALYDGNGAFGAAGIVVPSPLFIAKNDARFNLAFAQGYQAFKSLLAEAGAFGYEIRDLAPGTCYTAVLTTPNYPHYQRRVCTGAAGTTATLNVDLDSAVGAGATVTGVVKSSEATPVAIPNAAVTLSLEGSGDRSTTTDANGAFKFEGLSGGLSKISVSADGYAKALLEQALVGSNSYQEQVFLYSAPGSITGTVYSQKLPFVKVQPGAQIVAYDDTYNGEHPTLPLPLLKTQTGSDGTYALDGLVPGHVYKVFLKVPGKYTLNVATPATSGVVSGVDFTMLPKPLDIEVFARMNAGRGVYEFTVLNPQDFKTGDVTWSEAPYNAGSASTVVMNKLSSGELHGEIALSLLAPDKTYVLHGAAASYAGKSVVRELLFGKNYKGNAEQHIDDIMLGDDADDGTGRRGNEAGVDKSGADPSALVLPAGALLTSTAAAIPTCSFQAEDKNSPAAADKVAAVSGAEVAGNLYTVSLSSVAQTDRSIELTLAYDKSIADASTLNVAQFNASSGKWDTVPGLATVNPLKGTVTVKLKKLASVLSRRSPGVQAVFDGRQYVVRPQAAGGSVTTSGTFAVLNYVGDNLPAGSSKLKVFNYPNPFNLKTKAMASDPLNNPHNAVGMPNTTTGTMIHVEVPAANGGACHIRIYTLAGELVKDISETCTGGKYNYFAWDGRNKDGREVANGVYYGVVDLSGPKPDREDATFKMAVIK